MTPFKVWIAGPRGWENPEPIEKVMRKVISQFGVARLVVINGGSPGVDSLTTAVCQELGVPVFENKALWGLWNHRAGPIRNRLIRDIFEPNLLIAFHYYGFGTNNHKGTADAIKFAKGVSMPVRTVQVPVGVALPSTEAPNAPGAKGRAKQAARQAKGG